MIYNIGKAFNKNWITDTFRVMLLTSAYTPNADHDFVSDVVANECPATGNYVRKTLTNKTITINDTADRAEHDADTVTWTNLTATFRYAVIFRFVTNDADSPLQEVVDLLAQSISATDFSLLWNSGAVSGTVIRGT